MAFFRNFGVQIDDLGQIWHQIYVKSTELCQNFLSDTCGVGAISVVVGGSSCYLKTVSVSHMLPDLRLLSRAVLGLRMPLFPSFSDHPVQFPRARSSLFTLFTF